MSAFSQLLIVARSRKIFSHAIHEIACLLQGGPMLKGSIIAALAVVGLLLVDQHFYDGRYTDGTLAMLSAIKHSFRF
jgi:hypothetical protein